MLAYAPGHRLIIWVLLRGPPSVVEPVWEPSRPAVGLEVSRRGSLGSASQMVGSEELVLHVADPCVPGRACRARECGDRWKGIGRQKREKGWLEWGAPLIAPQGDLSLDMIRCAAGDLNYETRLLPRKALICGLSSCFR